MTPWWHILRFLLDGDWEPSDVKGHSHKEVTEKKLLHEVKRLLVKVSKLKRRVRSDKQPHGGQGKTYALNVLKPLMKKRHMSSSKHRLDWLGGNWGDPGFHCRTRLYVWACIVQVPNCTGSLAPSSTCPAGRLYNEHWGSWTIILASSWSF